MTLFALVFAAFLFAFPISTLIVGKTIQPRHYLYEMAFCLDLMLCFVLGLTFQSVWEYRFAGITQRKIKWLRGRVYLFTFLIATCTFWALKSHNVEFAGKRSDTGQLKTLFDFDDVKNFLLTNNFNGVLATNSPMLGSWWAGLQNGLLLMPHAGASTLSDRDLALGVARFGRLMKLSDEEYKKMLTLGDFQASYVGHFKHVWTKFTQSGKKYDTKLKPHTDIFAKGPLVMAIEDQHVFLEAFKREVSSNFENQIIVVLKGEFFEPTLLARNVTIYENESYVIKSLD